MEGIMIKNRRLHILPILGVLVVSLVLPPYVKAQTDEKAKLLKSYFGDYREAKKVKKQAKTSLSVWEPQIKYVKSLSPSMQAIMLDGVENLNIDYDEIWIWENDEGLSPSEKRKFKGKNDIYKLYWKQNTIQACTIEKYYVGDPFTGQKLSKPSHKMWNIYNRDFILRKLGGK
jgi:hypothetical protein